MRSQDLLPLFPCALALGLFACSSSGGTLDSGGGGMDATSGPDSGSTAPDSGVTGRDSGPAADGGPSRDGGGTDASRPDSGPHDSGPPVDYGTKLATFSSASAPAQIVGVPLDESQIYYINGGELFSVPPTGGSPTDRGPAPMAWYPQPPGNNLWMLTTITTTTLGPGRANLAVLRSTSTAAPTLRLQNVVENQVFVGPDTNYVITAANLKLGGNSVATGTLTLDLVSMRASDGMMRTLIPGLHVTPWNMMAGDFNPPCGINAVFVSATTAFVSACNNPSAGHMDKRKLFWVDIVEGSYTMVAQDSRGFIQAGHDKSYALFDDSQGKLYGVDAMGTMVIPLVETTTVSFLSILNGKRFAYGTMTGGVKVAAYPSMMPSTILAMGAIALFGGSPSGAYVTIGKTMGTTMGLGDLFLLSTATAAAAMPVTLNMTTDGYPGDDTFSADSAYVYWYSGADSNFIGDIHGKKTATSDPAVLLSPGSYLVNNYSDPNSVILLANAATRPAGRGMTRVIADLTVRKRDASTPATVLVPAIDTSDFLLFPATKSKFVFKILDDASNLGLYVHDLPPG